MAWKRKKTTAEPETSAPQEAPPPSSDARYPGSAGYAGYGLRKNAMPENRFKFVRPEDNRRD